VLTEGQGIPLAVVVAGANRHDMKLLADTLDAVVVERPEPTEAAPQHVCLDKGYDYDECRQVAAQHDYIAHIRSRGEEQREKREIPGYRPRRWVVEVCHSWLNRFRKIPHSIGFSGKRIVSYGKGRSTLDLPLIHEVQSQDQP